MENIFFRDFFKYFKYFTNFFFFSKFLLNFLKFFFGHFLIFFFGYFFIFFVVLLIFQFFAYYCRANFSSFLLNLDGFYSGILVFARSQIYYNFIIFLFNFNFNFLCYCSLYKVKNRHLYHLESPLFFSKFYFLYTLVTIHIKFQNNLTMEILLFFKVKELENLLSFFKFLNLK